MDEQVGCISGKLLNNKSLSSPRKTCSKATFSTTDST